MKSDLNLASCAWVIACKLQHEIRFKSSKLCLGHRVWGSEARPQQGRRLPNQRRGRAIKLSLRSAAADDHDYHMNDKDNHDYHVNDKDMIRIIMRGRAREALLRSTAADDHDYHMNDMIIIWSGLSGEAWQENCRWDQQLPTVIIMLQWW